MKRKLWFIFPVVYLCLYFILVPFCGLAHLLSMPAMLLTDRLAIKLGYNPYTDNYYEFWALGMLVAVIEYGLLGFLVDFILQRTGRNR